MDFNADDFTVINMDDYNCPKQQDGYNCGVFCMMFVDFISHGYDYCLVEHSRMSHFRSYIAISLKQGTNYYYYLLLLLFIIIIIIINIIINIINNYFFLNNNNRLFRK